MSINYDDLLVMKNLKVATKEDLEREELGLRPLFLVFNETYIHVSGVSRVEPEQKLERYLKYRDERGIYIISDGNKVYMDRWAILKEEDSLKFGKDKEREEAFKDSFQRFYWDMKYNQTLYVISENGATVTGIASIEVRRKTVRRYKKYRDENGVYVISDKYKIYEDKWIPYEDVKDEIGGLSDEREVVGNRKRVQKGKRLHWK